MRHVLAPDVYYDIFIEAAMPRFVEALPTQRLVAATCYG